MSLLLHNRKSRQQLEVELRQESFTRAVASFYRYVSIADPQHLRDELYLSWQAMNILGRIYLAKEGINAQVSVPTPNWEAFIASLKQWQELKDVFVNRSPRNQGESFIKLKIKVRQKILADGMSENILDDYPVGKHLTPREFHQALDNPDVTVVDIRNGYECEIGHFRNAILPQADNYIQLLPELSQRLSGQEEKPIYLYCTGGIRCEKASAYLHKSGFKHVYQLQGGIVNYLNAVAEQGMVSHYQGSLFVFDGRMAERNSDEKLGRCYQCGAAHDAHVDCALESCHQLIIQCPTCRDRFQGCCSTECLDQLRLVVSSSAPLGMTLP